MIYAKVKVDTLRSAVERLEGSNGDGKEMVGPSVGAVANIAKTECAGRESNP
jgi:hypothetical protein